MSELFEHQRKLLELNPSKWLLAWGTGSGKTRTAIELCKDKGKTLVVCPKSLTENWQNEFNKWGASNKYIGPIKILSKEKFKKFYKELEAYDSIIIDEAHYFSNYKSGMTKALYEYIKKYKCKNIYLLTATPYLSTPWNIYSLAKILGLNWNWYVYKRSFFYDIKLGRRKIPVIKKGIEGNIASLVNKLGSTVKLEDCFDVPEQIYQNEYFELTKEQKEGIESLNDVVPIVRFTKIHQICGGSLKGDQYTATKYFDSEKVSRLLEIISEHKLISVIFRYNAEINHLYERIKETYPSKEIFRITGEVNNRHEIVDTINRRDDAVILVNAACSEGWGTPRIPIMVFYSYDFSLKNYIQMCGRIQRAGNIKKNIYLSLIVKGTIDEDIYKKVVLEKQDFHLEIYDKTNNGTKKCVEIL